MNRLVFITIVTLLSLTLASAQVKSKYAKILKEQRFNAGDGRAGSAFATEDGTVFREEIDASGNRIGQYSYIDAQGKTFTVKYSAGKDGFRILEGDHIRATGQEAAAYDANFDTPQESTPIQPMINNPRSFGNTNGIPVQQLNQHHSNGNNNNNNNDFTPTKNTKLDSNPFVNPHDPTHRDFQFNQHGGNFAPASGAVYQNSFKVPNCADCAGFNPFVNPYDASHHQQAVAGPNHFINPYDVSHKQGSHLSGHHVNHPVPALQQQQQQSRHAGQIYQPFQPNAFAASTNAQPLVTTETPIRHYPPGQLQLNRFETGFNFDFQS